MLTTYCDIPLFACSKRCIDSLNHCDQCIDIIIAKFLQETSGNRQDNNHYLICHSRYPVVITITKFHHPSLGNRWDSNLLQVSTDYSIVITVIKYHKGRSPPLFDNRQDMATPIAYLSPSNVMYAHRQIYPVVIMITKLFADHLQPFGNRWNNLFTVLNYFIVIMVIHMIKIIMGEILSYCVDNNNLLGVLC